MQILMALGAHSETDLSLTAIVAAKEGG